MPSVNVAVATSCTVVPLGGVGDAGVIASVAATAAVTSIPAVPLNPEKSAVTWVLPTLAAGGRWDVAMRTISP